jgi:uncharacterized membrane protein YebE (DUF533 family)
MMEKALIDKLFGPAINQTITPKTNINWTNILLIGGLLALSYLAYKNYSNEQKNKKN